MNDDTWDDVSIPDSTEKYTDYRPSHEVIPHWSQPKPIWAMSDEEFWRSQVAGRLLHHHERRTIEKTSFRRHASVTGTPNLGEQISEWINGRAELSAFTSDQLSQAEEEVRSLRKSGVLPKSFDAFKRDPLPKTFREFRRTRDAK